MWVWTKLFINFDTLLILFNVLFSLKKGKSKSCFAQKCKRPHCQFRRSQWLHVTLASILLRFHASFINVLMKANKHVLLSNRYAPLQVVKVPMDGTSEKPGLINLLARGVKTAQNYSIINVNYFFFLSNRNVTWSPPWLWRNLGWPLSVSHTRQSTRQ